MADWEQNALTATSAPSTEPARRGRCRASPRPSTTAGSRSTLTRRPHGRAEERRGQRPLRQECQLCLVQPRPLKPKPLPSSPTATASRRDGDFLQGHWEPSKCDRSNIEWGGKPQFFRFDFSNELNFAFRWREYERTHLCPTDARGFWPAFSPSGDNTPYTSVTLAAECSRLFQHALGQEEADSRTFHSYGRA